MTKQQFIELPKGMLISLVGGKHQDSARVVGADAIRGGLFLRYLTGENFFVFSRDAALYYVPGVPGTKTNRNPPLKSSSDEA